MVFRASWRLMTSMDVRVSMQHAHLKAVNALENLADIELKEALRQVRILYGIKTAIEEKARSMGISKACREAIPVCRGECCRRHFPKNLTVADFFSALTYLREGEYEKLHRLLHAPGGPPRGCPLVKDDGCFFSFDARPMVCTAAYPCFVKNAYWQFYKDRQKEISTARQALEKIICPMD